MTSTPDPACGRPDYPQVLNGKIVSGTELARSVEYECLSGFVMTGSKKISCDINTKTWGTQPTCSVIDNSDKITVFPDWWFFILAAVLGLMLLLCLICIICYFCCGRGNTVHPYHDGYANDGCCSCCRRRRNRDVGMYDQNGYYTPPGRDGIYYIPVRSSQVAHSNTIVHHPNQRDVNSAKSPSRSFGTQTRQDQEDTDTYTAGKNGAVNSSVHDNYSEKPTKDRHAYYNGKEWMTSNGVTSTHATQTPNGTAPHDHANGDWNRDSRDSKTWKDSFNTDTQTKSENGDPYSTHKHPHLVQPSKPAKEVRAWMPHAKPVRNDHNTSTK